MDVADRPEQVQREVQPVHAGSGQQAAASQVGGALPAAPGGSHAQAQPDEHRPPDGPGVDEPFGLGVRGVEDLVVGHAERHSRGGRGIDELAAFIGAERQRLLHEHVLAGQDGRHGHTEVQVVRQADRHGADLGVGDQVVGADVAAYAPRLERPQELRCGVGHGQEAGGP